MARFARLGMSAGHPHPACFADVAKRGTHFHLRLSARGRPLNTLAAILHISEQLNEKRKKPRRAEMKTTKIVNIELVAEIEELELKLAPSGAATLGDL